MDTVFTVKAHVFDEVPLYISIDVTYEADNCALLSMHGNFMRNGHLRTLKKSIGYVAVTARDALKTMERCMGIQNVTNRTPHFHPFGNRPKVFS